MLLLKFLTTTDGDPFSQNFVGLDHVGAMASASLKAPLAENRSRKTPLAHDLPLG